jgi:uncharacterized protein (DUF2147 family)
MKHFFLALAALAVAAVPASANGKSSLEGHWKKGHLEIVIAPCGAALCGTVVKASSRQQARAERGSGTELVGAQVISNIRPTGPGTYRADVFVADRNVNARGTIREAGANRLTVRGCVLAIICKTATWERVSR